MIDLLATLGAAVVALAALIALREARWRRLIAAELASEVSLGILAERDFRMLLGWRRFRAGWFGGSRERREFRRIAGRLARAKSVQRRAAGESSRLLQVQVLTLRTRLRRLESRPGSGTADVFQVD